MKLILKPVDKDNYMDVIKLSVHENQTNFVAPNIKSLAEAYIFAGCAPHAIYDGETLVGFTMWRINPESKQAWIHRLMIDKGHQGKGYGSAAMQSAIDVIKSGDKEYDGIYTSYEQTNATADHVYRKLGFEPTGVMHKDEVEMKLKTD